MVIACAGHTASHFAVELGHTKGTHRTKEVLVLGVKRSGGDYVGAPPADLRLRPEDFVVLYGRKHRLHELSTRASGDHAAHREARAEHAHDRGEQREQLEREGAT